MQNRCGIRRFDKHRVESTPITTPQALEIEQRLAALQQERASLASSPTITSHMNEATTVPPPSPALSALPTDVTYTPWRTPQSGLSEPASLRQSGLSEPASLRQSGLSEPASLRQSGLSEPASLRQSGLSEPASLRQSSS